jgi:hypothetical protein
LNLSQLTGSLAFNDFDYTTFTGTSPACARILFQDQPSVEHSFDYAVRQIIGMPGRVRFMFSRRKI